MADSTLSSLSPPPPSDLVPVLPGVDCGVEADSNSTELRVPCSGGPDEKLLNDVNSDVIEASTSKPVDRILNNIDVHQSPAICSKIGHIESISDGKNISISGPNDDISLMNNPNTDGSQSNDTSHLQLTKTNIHSHFNLCSNKADSANVLEEESKNSLSVSSAELNHLPSSVLPTHNASLPCQSAVKINNIDNRVPLLEQLSHPVVMDTKEDSLSVNSIDSLAFTKSGSSLSLDETSSKDSLLTSTESKSMSSSPEADQLPNDGMCLNNFEEPSGPVSSCSEHVEIKMKMSTPELPNKKLPVNTETEANSSCQPSDALNCTNPCQEHVTQDNVAKLEPLLVTSASDNPSFSSNSLIVELSGSTPESAAQADTIEASTVHAVNEVDTKCEDGSEANAHPATGQNETINPVTANSSPNLPVENNLSNADKTSSSEEIQLECALELPRCIDSGPVECPENFSQSELCASATRNKSENSSDVYEQTKCTLNPANDLENDNVKAVTVPKIILQQEDNDQLSEESHTDKCQASAEVTEEAEADVMETEPVIELSTACDEAPSGCNEVSTNQVIQGNIGEDADFCKMDTDVVDESVQINSLADGKCKSTSEKDVPAISLHSTTKIIAVPTDIPIVTDIIKTSCAGAETFEELPVESNSVCSAAATDRKDAVQLKPAMNTEFMAVTAEKPLKAETSSNEVDEANIELSTPESSTDKNVIEKCIFPEISPALKTVSNLSEIMSNEDSSESSAELGACKSLDEDQSASNELMPEETSHSQDRMHDNNDLAESLACENSNGVLQTVVGGVLQALDVAALEARKKEEEESDNRKLFVGIDEELQDSGNVLSCTTAMHVLENDAEETDGIGGLVINSVVGAFGEAVEESADGDSTTECDGRSKEFADISSPYLNMSKPTFAEECNDEMQSKRPQLENSEAEIQRPVIFKVKPVKGIANSFWDSPKLRAALEEKGTVLLRLCTAEPTEDFEISADFIGVMLDCSEETMYGGSAGHRNGGLDVYSFGPEGGYHPGVYPSYAYQHVRNPGAAEEDFESTEEMEESLDYDGANQTLEWQGKKASAAYGSHQFMPPPPPLTSGGYYMPTPGGGPPPLSPPFMRGKRKHGMRGRPPVHVRGVYHMIAPAPAPAAAGPVSPQRPALGATVALSYPQHHYYSLPAPYVSSAGHTLPSPSTATVNTGSKTKASVGSKTDTKAEVKSTGIMFRPPTPPLLTENSGAGVVLSGPLRRCSSLLSVRRPAPGSILSQQMKLLHKEEDDEDFPICVKPQGGRFLGMAKKKKASPVVKNQKFYCDFCPSRFRKRAAMIAHVKHKHKFMKKCPICNVGIKVTGKYNMKFHMLKEHKEVNSFACGDCGAVFKLQHHLKNHVRLGCDPSELQSNTAEATVNCDPSLSKADIQVPPAEDLQNDKELELLGSDVVADQDQEVPPAREHLQNGDGFDDRPGASTNKRKRSRQSESGSDVDDKTKEESSKSKTQRIEPGISKPASKRLRVDLSSDNLAGMNKVGNSSKEAHSETRVAKVPTTDKGSEPNQDESETTSPRHSTATQSEKMKLGEDKCDGKHAPCSKGESDRERAETTAEESDSASSKPKPAKVLRKRGRKPKLKPPVQADSSDESDHGERSEPRTVLPMSRTNSETNDGPLESEGELDKRLANDSKSANSDVENQFKCKKVQLTEVASVASEESDSYGNQSKDQSSKSLVSRPSVVDSSKPASASDGEKMVKRAESSLSRRHSRMRSSPSRSSRRMKSPDMVIETTNAKVQSVLKRLKIDDGRTSRSNSDSDGSSSESEIEEKKRFFCTSCDAGFSHAFKLRHHRREVHEGGGGSALPSSVKGVINEAEPAALTCTECDKQFRNKYQLRLHSRIHSNNVIKLVKAPGRKPLGRPPKDKTKLMLRNAALELLARQAAEMQEAKLSSSVETPALNDITSSVSSSSEPKSNSSLNQLPSHIIKKRNLFVCTKCSLTFKRESSVTYHMKKIHETLYPFKACPHCGRIFRSCGPYNKHLRLHLVRRCPVEGCKARYRIFRKMKQHQKTSHEDYPHRCSSCDMLYKTQDELEEHAKTAHVKLETQDDDEEDASEGEQQQDDDDAKEEQQHDTEVEVTEEKPRLSLIDKIEIENLPNKRRTRTELSYKEDEEDDLLLKRKKPASLSKKSPFKLKTGLSQAASKVSAGVENCRSKKILNEVEKLKKTDFDIFKRNDELDRGSRRKSSEESIGNEIITVVEPKKVINKKKISMSWTAALKARIKAEARAEASGKPLQASGPKVNRPKTPKSPSAVKSPKSTSGNKSHKLAGNAKSPKSPPGVKPPKSPAFAAAESAKVPPSPSEIVASENLAALVVRRVAETLASQEMADLKVPTAEPYTPTTPSPASSAPPPPPTPPPSVPTPPSMPPHYAAYPTPYAFPHHYYGYPPHLPPHLPPPMYHHSFPPFHSPHPHFQHAPYHPPYAGSEDSCSSLDTHQENSSNSTDRPDSPNKVLRFDNF
ncbi:uncharacterized protein LOC108673323 [Hyalella azteca]|uniref:Uncharacterized protein LOC108673323 n=1 Tax=Hyalella azteca TaxID=294128 RepID=A0A8B7NUG7_HYAAZ|nr:uncharacterized protein LOC108673323 [Hyalella azteca]